jgi:hypothetical protein
MFPRTGRPSVSPTRLRLGFAFGDMQQEHAVIKDKKCERRHEERQPRRQQKQMGLSNIQLDVEVQRAHLSVSSSTRLTLRNISCLLLATPKTDRQ